MKADNLKYIFYFLLFIGLQIVFFLNLALFNIAFCFVYIGFIITLPIETPRVFLLFIGFFTGIVIDVFYNTLGIHTAASLLVAYMRPYTINMLTPRGGYDTGSEVSIHHLGMQWFVSFTGILVFSHHLTLFLLEAFSFDMLGRTLLKTFTSTAFTLFIIVLLQYLLYSPRKS
jgi:hypothetical protein